MTVTGGRGLEIGIGAHYRDVVSQRWPVIVAPQSEELLSSWLHRLAIANGVAPRDFARVLGPGSGPGSGLWTASLDLRLPAPVAACLLTHTGVSRQKLVAMSLKRSAWRPLLLPLRSRGRRGRSTWLQYCPCCLAEDAQPYFRRRWRLATWISCPDHGCGLRDRCRSCGSGIAASDQPDLAPQHLCVRCGFDLRRAPKVAVSTSARRLERCIDDICRLEAVTGRLTGTLTGNLGGSPLVQSLQRLPAIAGLAPTSPLSGLSTSARRRCFEQLARTPCTWLTAGDDGVVVHWRRLILAAGGTGALMGQLVKALERGRHLQASPSRSVPKADLPALLAAYLDLKVQPPRPDLRLHPLAARAGPSRAPDG
ncbi:TniQ family protein (plasmid) [Labrenzia sp. 5N]|uniref:TniQ family protein n=1 Tax=Labrenzia sp. 5N TaxID=2723402 RepID=UPI0014465988|nr:TniQ family protein [Labrenzia sp. 5N]NKX68265.1 TniQ family protein [Labrenzia sp. 5N]